MSGTNPLRGEIGQILPTTADVELVTAEWVQWYNDNASMSYCGGVPPIELETAFYAQFQGPAAPELGGGPGKPEGNDVVPMNAFQQGDVYIDYPFDDAKFRYEHATSRVFGRFNNRAEVEVDYTNDLFRDAMRSGAQIDREQYFGD